jgi:ArsR family transcriptional regulator
MLGRMTAVELPVLSPRERGANGCWAPVVEPDLGTERAIELAAVVKALADPTRLRIVDALRKSAPEALCQCELAPLFAISQQALAKHLKVLIGAGVVGSERRGVWAYYFLRPDPLRELQTWLS